MKKIWIVLLCGLCLTGCGATETMETISDDLEVSAQLPAAQVELSVPGEMETAVLDAGDGSRLYMCDGYTVTVQTLNGGDLEKSVQTVTGFSKDSLTVMQTEAEGIVTYECAWSATGEEGDQTCRAVILDDGMYHYAVTVMADYSLGGDLRETWQEILGSVKLRTD